MAWQSIESQLTLDGKTVTLSRHFTVYPTESISSVWPTRASRRGGTVVTISGTNFLPGAQCQFGENYGVVMARVSNGTHLTCVVPPIPHHSRGERTRLVVSNNGIFASGARAGFAYQDILISSVSPRGGPLTGGTFLSVIGSGFSVVSEAVCRFDNLFVVPARVSSDDTLVCETPALDGPPRPSILDVVLDGHVYGNFEFDYHHSLTLKSLFPSFGPEHGGSSIYVEVTGSLSSWRRSMRSECVF
ncbi:MAG: IPT/TIG domain-containing protein, partial [Pseudomonadota bacterium]